MAALALHGSGNAQMPFPIPVGPEVLVVPLLLLFGSLAVEFSQRDAKLVRTLGDARDWDGLERLATERLEQRPASPSGAASQPPDPADSGRAEHWLGVRALARQRLGRCAGALDDYEAARRLARDPSPAAELNRGLCLMSLGRWEQAEQAMRSLAQLTPQAWEPWYNLGVIRAIVGDLPGAQEAHRELRTRDAARTAALERDFLSPDSDSAATALAAAPVIADESRITLAGRTLRLPLQRWQEISTLPSTVMGGSNPVHPHQMHTAVSVLTTTAIAVDSGQMRGAARFTVNRPAPLGISTWNVDACSPVDPIHVDRFEGRFDTPECLSVRRAGGRLAAAQGVFGPAIQAARERGAASDSSYFEIHYSIYGIDRFVRIDLLLPVRAFAGDLVVIDWAQTLASAMRPLVARGASSAAVPTPGRWTAPAQAHGS